MPDDNHALSPFAQAALDLLQSRRTPRRVEGRTV